MTELTQRTRRARQTETLASNVRTRGTRNIQPSTTYSHQRPSSTMDPERTGARRRAARRRRTAAAALPSGGRIPRDVPGTTMRRRPRAAASRRRSFRAARPRGAPARRAVSGGPRRRGGARSRRRAVGLGGTRPRGKRAGLGSPARGGWRDRRGRAPPPRTAAAARGREGRRRGGRRLLRPGVAVLATFDRVPREEPPHGSG